MTEKPLFNGFYMSSMTSPAVIDFLSLDSMVPIFLSGERASPKNCHLLLFRNSIFDSKIFFAKNTKFSRIQSNKKAYSCILIMHRNRPIFVYYASLASHLRGARGKPAVQGKGYTCKANPDQNLASAVLVCS